MNPRKGNNFRAWNFDGDPQLAQERRRGQGHGCYEAYAVDLGAEDEAHTWEFEDMATHSHGQGPARGHPTNINVDHEGHASHLNANDADFTLLEFVGVVEEKT